ncbi:MAG: hypothetical protein ACE5OY_06290 [Candidatus Bathyarchaeia archaeon]
MESYGYARGSISRAAEDAYGAGFLNTEHSLRGSGSRRIPWQPYGYAERRG